MDALCSNDPLFVDELRGALVAISSGLNLETFNLNMMGTQDIRRSMEALDCGCENRQLSTLTLAKLLPILFKAS